MVERLNRCGEEQMQEKRVTREICRMEGYEEWTRERCMDWEE